MTYNSTVFGPTLDTYDKLFTGQPLPELQVGDWFLFSKICAYTAVCGSSFNGFNTADIPTCLLIKIELTGHVKNWLVCFLLPPWLLVFAPFLFFNFIIL